MPTISLSVTSKQKETLKSQAENQGLTLNQMLKQMVLGETSATFNNTQRINDTTQENDIKNKETMMSTNEHCPDCLRHEMNLELKERDLDEAREEASYWQTQARQASEELGRVTRIAQSLEAESNTDRHSDIGSLLACPNCGPRAIAELPGVISKKQALSIARRHAPELFEPVKLKIK